MSDDLMNQSAGTSSTSDTPSSLGTSPPRTPSVGESREPHQQSEADHIQEREGVSGTAPPENNPRAASPAPFKLNEASPVGKKSYHDSTRFASVQDPTVDKKRGDVRLSMAGKTIILSFEEFMEKLVPAPLGETEPVERFKTVDFSSIPQKLEADMYTPLKDALNQTWLLPNDVAVSTPHKSDGTVASNQKIDGGLYPRVNAPQDATSWSSIELSIECKTECTQQDPFDDRKDDSEASAITRKDVRGQIMCYAVLVFDNQHRMHHFTLLILDAMARLIRWDRSGVLVTKKFDYTKEGEKLAQFLWRYGRMSPEQRGHDPTAVRILPGTPEYEHILTRATVPMLAPNGAAIGEHARKMFYNSVMITKTAKGQDKDSEGAAIHAPFWRLTVHDASGNRHFLVGNPHTTASSLAGRGTRTYVAIDAEDRNGPFVYLKDAWRVAHEGIEQEGSILSVLNDDSNDGPVEGVPTLICHGDVEDQVTFSQKVWQEKHPDVKTEDCPLKTHRHYRLVVKEVCLPMRDFLSFLELVLLIHFCIEAHGQAYTRKKFLHRDISAGNVLIYPVEEFVDGKVVTERIGVLSDWELAKKVVDPDDRDGHRQVNRTGTWQFASASALNNPTKRIIVQDDMESFFHLMFYFAIRYLPHNCENIGQFMEAYFDGHVERKGIYYGGEKKLTAMRNGSLTTLLALPLVFYKPKARTQSNATEASSKDQASSRDQATQTPHIPPEDSTAQSIKSEDACIAGNASPPATSHSSAPSVQSVQVIEEPTELHPINDLFSDILQRIKAHYALYVPQKPVTGAIPIPADQHPALEATDAAVVSSVGSLLRKLQASKARRKAPVARTLARAAPAMRATSEIYDASLRALAPELGDHGAMDSLLEEHIKRPVWPSYADRVPDQLPAKYKRGLGTAIGSKRTYESTFDSTDAGTEGSLTKRPRSMR